MSSCPDRLDWPDLLRAAACLMVILLHSAAPFVLELSVYTPGWTAANVVDSLTRVSVPLFFMLSGYLFLGERTPQGRHFLRILSALGFYSLLALGLSWATTGAFPATRIALLPFQPAFYHLWFFYALLGIYLLATILSLRNPSSSRVLPLLLLAIALNPAIVDRLSEIAGEPSPLAVSGPTISYFLYAVAGAVLGRVDIPPGLRGTAKAVLPFVFLASQLGVAGLTLHESRMDGEFISIYYAYAHPLNAIGAMALFAWVRLFALPRGLVRAARAISRRSLAIYGLHAFFLAGIMRFLPLDGAPVLLAIGAYFSLTLALSWVSAGLLCAIDRKGWVT